MADDPPRRVFLSASSRATAAVRAAVSTKAVTSTASRAVAAVRATCRGLSLRDAAKIMAFTAKDIATLLGMEGGRPPGMPWHEIALQLETKIRPKHPGSSQSYIEGLILSQWPKGEDDPKPPSSRSLKEFLRESKKQVR